ncbi:HRAS-like suppressor 2 [Parambassis ranga]|uniref:HRAS-like suppressor 2 n=1 Tax=Parambassis ranga TaxID=210632 RepID=A0A6P7JWV1_9TELE|nr:HRAS-like suppressor 2 [Parambassis ranga]
MRTLISVGMILHLVITVNSDTFKFGDILSTRRCADCFKHFAVWVGDRQLDDKESGQNIFHRQGLLKTECIFDTLSNPHNYEKDNYLDGAENITIATDQEITQRIQEKHQNCLMYNPTSRNCEHLATYIRYGIAISEQRGVIARYLCKREGGYESDAQSCEAAEDLLKGLEEDSAKTCDLPTNAG